MLNVEIKARLTDLNQARQVAASLGAEHSATRQQTDTYFRVLAGRLKLREQTDHPPVLIFYHRPDQPDPKASDYQLVAVEEGAGMRQLLSDALGIRTQVRKQRELWLVDNIRIHLDTVEELGTFIEFEVMVIDGHTEAKCRAQAQALCEAFGIGEADLIAGSYADLSTNL
jgi:predicted adenylyl cyclase CyaB